MGKKKKGKKKKNNNNIVEPPQETPEKIDLGRRKLLQYGLGCIALIAGGASLPILARMVPGEEDKWDFVHRPMLSDEDTKYNIQSVGQNPGMFIPIDEPKEVGKEDAEREIKRVMGQIQQKAREEGWTKVDVEVTRQNFGRVDDNPAAAKRFKNYVETARDFLYTRLPDLPSVGIELVILKQGDDYTKNANGKGFIALTNHHLYTLSCRDRITGECAKATTGHNDHGSITFLHYNRRTDTTDSWIIFGSAGYSVIASPFSELIPYAMIEQHKRLVDKKGGQAAVVMAETISEGLSYLLSEEIVNVLGITDGHKVIEKGLEKILKNKPKRYCHVPDAIKWLRQNGMQKGLDIYMRDPDKFMRLIK